MLTGHYIQLVIEISVNKVLGPEHISLLHRILQRFKTVRNS